MAIKKSCCGNNRNDECQNQLFESHVRSRKRVEAHGEVLTGQREVNAMLDLVKNETERIDSRFLEPACGDGNFLVEILRRKLLVVRGRYGKSQLDYERYALVAVASIYGIDILEDNVRVCRERLLGMAVSEYAEQFKKIIKSGFVSSAKFILNCNIIHGNALSLKSIGPEPTPIVFSEWSLVTGGKIKRRDYSYQELLIERTPMEKTLVSDDGNAVFIPTPLNEYPLVSILELADAYNH